MVSCQAGRPRALRGRQFRAAYIAVDLEVRRRRSGAGGSLAAGKLTAGRDGVVRELKRLARCGR